MKKLQTRESVLLVVLAVTAAVVGYMNFGQGGFGSSGSDSAEDDLKIGEAPEVRLARLAQEAADYPANRDLFAYGSPPPPPRANVPPPARPQKIERQPPKPVTRPPVRDRTPPPPPKPKPPVPTFKYVGYFGPKFDKIAAFDDGEQMLLARVGETIQDEFLLMDFEFQAVRLGFTDKRFEGQDTELSLTIPGGTRATSNAPRTQDGQRRGRRRR